jgi:hypothetical protein
VDWAKKRRGYAKLRRLGSLMQDKGSVAKNDTCISTDASVSSIAAGHSDKLLGQREHHDSELVAHCPAHVFRTGMDRLSVQNPKAVLKSSDGRILELNAGLQKIYNLLWIVPVWSTLER